MKPRVYLQAGANVPKEWRIPNESNLEYYTVIMPSWSTDGSYKIKIYYEDSRMECECLAFTYHGVCHHIRALKWICYKPAHKRGLQDTSLEAYRKIKDNMAARNAQVYNYLERNGPQQLRRIAEGLGLPTHWITGRIKDLRDELALVGDYGRVYDSVTKKTVHLWGVIG